MKVSHFVHCMLISFICFNIGATLAQKSTSCKLRFTDNGKVCVCTDAYCDYLQNPQLSDKNVIVVVSSSELGLRFSTTFGHFSKKRITIADYAESAEVTHARSALYGFDPLAVLVDGTNRGFLQYFFSASRGNAATEQKVLKLQVNRERKFQKITGFGGSFTGTVSYLIQLLKPELQDHIYKSFFHKDGIAYNLMRMSIGGSDFDMKPWAYNEQPQHDLQLSNFSKLDPRDEQKVKQLTRMKQVANLDSIRIMASAWSAPRWMKTNNNWTGPSALKREYYQTWANYHLRFLELMDAKNMPIWAITTGNEPLNGVLFWFFVRFISMGWTPQDQAIWLSDYLGPTIKNSKYNVQIFGNDEQRYTYPIWFQEMNRTRPNALRYLNGLAVHWYWDDFIDPRTIDETHALMPWATILNTESCIGDKPWEVTGPELGSWPRGVRYMRAYMQDLKHSVNGWIDWNIVLDEQGGPNYINNFVDASVIINATNRIEFYKQPIFYAIGHYSKFIGEGSQRIETQLVEDRDVDAVAFQRTDGSIAIVLVNAGTTAVDIALNDNRRGDILINLPADSMHTILYN